MAKKALLVGINDYKGVGDLRGCVNDVLDMHFSLRSLFNFQSREIRVLTDSRATKANTIHRLQWLVDGAKSGDFLVFHFSGHGSQIRDRDGDELVDQLDELICPYDMNWDGTFIIDDELNNIFRNVPEGALLEVFLDCCHSGTGLREMGLAPPPELAAEHPTLNRYLPPPADIQLRSSGEEDDLKLRGFMRGCKERNTKHSILWAGCMDNQTSADAHINGRYHGAFTYYLNVHLRRDPRVSRKELLRKVRTSLRHGGFSQDPQLEIEATRRDRVIFVDEEPK
ncbi:unnamed protein product [marine sediment metagenome]|uniref:Peptidase C14 caspase domain-containing protein n=1 Tax=marine sediment metagenome TaxID=412755 RepID=X0SQ26_9ZZZZ